MLVLSLRTSTQLQRCSNATLAAEVFADAKLVINAAVFIYAAAPEAAGELNEVEMIEPIASGRHGSSLQQFTGKWDVELVYG